jgi:hypothetical protein
MKPRLGNLERQLLAYAQLRRVRELRTDEAARDHGQAGAGALQPDGQSGASAERADGGSRRPIPALRPECIQPLRLQRPGPEPRLRLQQPALGGKDDRRDHADLIKVADARLGDTEKSTTRDGLSLAYSSRVRTLVDAVYDWSRFGSLPRGYGWITSELAEERVTASALVTCTLRYGDLGTIRRIGALLERRGVRAPLLRKLARALPESTGTVPLIPTMPKRGTLDRRWGLVINGEI